MEGLMSKGAQSELVVRLSTEQEPYRFVGSGLGNVYLIGVEYEVDAATGMQSAAVPCLPALMEAIGKVLVEKSTPLTGDELRFLRKRLRFASKDFAKLIGVSGEQYSRLENGATVTPTVERLVRLLYATLAKLPAEASEEVARTTWSASLSHEEKIVAMRDGAEKWVVLTTAA
jgi:transcriptional regulator with XRE-family HTH domain